ncbi:MAG: GNAT family N-acetyltransferase [Anaerolineales bacterium]|nr:GNAT family N-acetyltransferase [Anaerolineales bacterium]
MDSDETKTSSIDVFPLTVDRWEDFEELFGERGAYGGCWCMWWRESRREFEERGGEGNRRAMKAIVGSGKVPGLLYYVDGEPAAWCSIAPREQYDSLNRSRVLKPLDDKPVWSLVCFFVGKEFRNQGIIQDVLQGAIDYVRSNGGKVVETYPTVPKGGRLPPVSSFMGIPSMFERAGFVECARPSKSRAVYRYIID